MPRYNMGFAVAGSNLNNKNQFQGTLIAGVYPFANLNQYVLARISFLSEDDEINRHYKVITGSKIFSRLWIQGSYHTGELKNAHDENGLLVYNSSGKITSRATFTAFILLSNKLTLQFDYSLTKQEDSYLQYTTYTKYVWKAVNYNNHHIIGGLKWKL